VHAWLGPAVTLQWPPAPPEPSEQCLQLAQPEPLAVAADADGAGRVLPDPPAAGLTDPRLIAGVGEITAMIAAQLDDGASATEVMPVIRDTARRWLEGQVRAGLLPASAGGALDDLARAVHDQRYELGPVTAYLRDPQVENIDINGCDHVWITYASGERVAGPPVAASDDALISMVRTWATRGGQTARDFSAAAPLVNVALTGSARLTATMSVTPRPCVSLRRHGQIDASLERLIHLGTIDATLAAFLAAAVKSRCNIIVTGGVNCGKTTFR
jgi:pilus assembly protein CpaF